MNYRRDAMKSDQLIGELSDKYDTGSFLACAEWGSRIVKNANRIIATLRLKTLGPLVTGLCLLSYSGWQRHLEQVVPAAEGDLILTQGFVGVSESHRQRGFCTAVGFYRTV